MGFVGFCVLEVAVVCVWCSSGGDRGDASFFFFGGCYGVCGDGVVVVWVGFNVLGNLDPD